MTSRITRSDPRRSASHLATLAGAALLLAGCATGFGEAATGTVDVVVVPAGTVSGGVRFESAFLTVTGIELEEAEAEAGADGGHGHHHHLFEPAPLAGPVTLDLLGGAQTVRRLTVPASSFTALAVGQAPAFDGVAAGCAFFARGTATLDGDNVPVRICLKAVTGVLARVPLELDIGHEEEAEMRLLLSVNDLLTDVDVSLLPREGDGSIVIDARRPFEATVIRKNLESAFSTL
ncbi:hypothetical protein [Vulgatibacter incomptus]|uniref:Lipoprotein n=1 Tax=Vulgatibacter incomptus TaxID=1391653 RepID=A0A0K1PD86_9BACT|nr:hypothetical protein [Vulgatibacter incomptus]AKU91485.1 hypothetical protein AKJ08_1872 [Vulgatibacter incomptus]